jgi:ubiquinone/menaquinone biosynthesis C-methylase UbiE
MITAKERIDTATTTDRLQERLHEQRFEFVLSLLGEVESALELGTGVGSFSPRLAARCRHYTGVDYDADSVVQTSKRLMGKGEVLQADARSLPFRSHSFSAIVCLEVLEHLGDWRAGVSEIQRCLLPDGMAVLSVPFRTRGGKSASNPFHVYEPGEKELVSFLSQRFNQVILQYQFFPETLVMQIARRLRLRRVLGLTQPYRALSAGSPEALARLQISQKALGFKLHLLAVLREPRT